MVVADERTISPQDRQSAGRRFSHSFLTRSNFANQDVRGHTAQEGERRKSRLQ